MKYLIRCGFIVCFLVFSVDLFPQESVIVKTDSSQVDLPEMVFVHGGTFKMGSDVGGSDEKPVHSVRVNDFYIGKFEVTQKQWRDLMGVGTTENYFPGCDSCPVERVHWYNALEYIKRLNKRTGLKFRLPTEAEWEFAARGGRLTKGYRYSGGNDIDDVAWKDGNAYLHTHPVGTKHPNELGLYDMSGNVWEWCLDYYSPDYYEVSPYDNPTGPEFGTYRVFRGGSWFHDSQGLRPSARGSGNPAYYYGYVGFRLARDR
jgi:formylglycine-generating enzyme